AEGRTLADTLSGSDLFPPFVIQMISVGEQSGALENMLLKVSRSYEDEAASRLVVLTSLLEPVMILVMGLLVAFIVVSILLPIFEMNQLIR
ncbi:MAG TPA: type II secretion system F family protein, partial [Syntrophales bacterium]|nr:type II secretion system F family protein [Syntrophales bacterium]